MKVKARIERIPQNSTTTHPSHYCLSLKATGALSDCDELMDWIKKFGDKNFNEGENDE